MTSITNVVSRGPEMEDKSTCVCSLIDCWPDSSWLLRGRQVECVGQHTHLLILSEFRTAIKILILWISACKGLGALLKQSSLSIQIIICDFEEEGEERSRISPLYPMDDLFVLLFLVPLSPQTDP